MYFIRVMAKLIFRSHYSSLQCHKSQETFLIIISVKDNLYRNHDIYFIQIIWWKEQHLSETEIFCIIVTYS